MHAVDPRNIIRSSNARYFFLLIVMMLNLNCSNNSNQTNNNAAGWVHLIMLAPGHFHAALLQKSMYPEIDSNVYVYGPAGPELKSYLDLISQYNSREKDPTRWKENVYTGSDYLEKMLQQKRGNLVVMAGNNQKKTEYIRASIDAGLNVLADKPMAITEAGFIQLKAAFDEASKKKVLLYDIMTERYEITNILQKTFSRMPEVFGELEKGTPTDPSVIFESVHHFYKEVSGKPLIRPDWYFDVAQQGEGIVDVTTHLTDLIQWECFPETVFDYQKEVKILSAKHWPTILSPLQFKQVTGEASYPDFLKGELKDSMLQVYANGEFDYMLKGVHARVSAVWKFQAPKGGQDTYHALLKGSRANLVIRQGEEQHYKPVLYIEPVEESEAWQQSLEKGLQQVQQQYPGVSLEKADKGWRVRVPEKYEIGHEQHFAFVIKKYLQYLEKGSMPDWEKSFMLTKYYTTTQALKMAQSN